MDYQDHPAFWNRLEQLKQSNPAYLEELLLGDKLEKHLQGIVDQHYLATAQAMETYPHLDQRQIEEIANEHVVNLPDPSSEPKPMSQKAQSLLAEFELKMTEGAAGT